MSTTLMTILVLLTGAGAGFIGSLFGIGGAMLTTPVLVICLGVDIKMAIASGLIVVIATSTGSSIAYLKDEIINLRAAMFLELFTTTGGAVGAVLAGVIAPSILFFLYSALLMFSVINTVKKLVQESQSKKLHLPANNTDTTKKQKAQSNIEQDNILKLNGSYYDTALQKQVDYKPKRIAAGSVLMFFAGIISGVLGVGSGVFKVIALDNVMKMPIKVSTSTSNLMMGVTACAGAVIFLLSGSINPITVAPLAAGTLFGSTIGSKVMPHVKPKILRILFVPFLTLIAISMLLKAFGLWIY